MVSLAISKIKYICIATSVYVSDLIYILQAHARIIKIIDRAAQEAVAKNVIFTPM